MNTETIRLEICEQGLFTICRFALRVNRILFDADHELDLIRYRLPGMIRHGANPPSPNPDDASPELIRLNFPEPLPPSPELDRYNDARNYTGPAPLHGFRGPSTSLLDLLMGNFRW